MTRTASIALFACAVLSVACGDNSKECGENTEVDADGRCVGTGGPSMCANGTILDGDTGACVIDPAACQDGTVLINGACRNPNTDVTPDILEGAEPNGAGVVETSTTPAGEITLKPIGQSVIIKGTTNPFRDADLDGQKDADYDTYFVDVTAPTLLDIAVDGTNGTMSAFIVLASGASNPVNALGPWIRYGMNVTGDMSKRQVFLPTAGTYAIAFADTRSLFIDGDSPPAAGAGGAAGSATAHYYATIQQVALPTATPISLDANGDGEALGTVSGDVKTYAVTMGLGLNNVSVEMPGPSANPSVLVLEDGAYRRHVDEVQGVFGAQPASMYIAGFDTSDTALIVVDFTYNYGPDPEPFTLSVTTGTATALSTTGGTASAPLLTDTGENLGELSAFYYDVSGADEIDGIDLAWNTPVDGVLVDENLSIVASFTYDGGFFGDTWSEYVGLLRHRAAGRYYFLVYDPAGTPGTDTITATSRIERKVPVPVVKGTPLTAQPVDATYGSNAFTYAAGANVDAWQQFAATGTGTGAIALRFFDPETAYGRLDDVPSATFVVDDAVPLFAPTFAATGTPPVGRILLDDDTDDYLVIASTAITTGAPTLNLDFARRAHHDFGSLAAGASGTRTDESLDTAAVQRYLVRSAPASRLTLTVHPDNTLLDTRLQILAKDETVRQTVNTGGIGADDTVLLEQVGTGWTAFTVSSPLALPAGTNTFDVTASVEAPVAYAVASTTTAYADACTGTGSSTVALTATGSDPAGDEGLSAASAAPAGFTFYGFPVTTVRVSSNGFLSFGAVTSAGFTNADLPGAGAPNALIAPYWDDLVGVTVCRKTVGTMTTFQWTGARFADAAVVAFQAILDSSDNSIELVYATSHVPTGASATIGIENGPGTAAQEIGFNTAGVITPGAGKKLTPM